jgi:hypothetical protein
MTVSQHTFTALKFSVITTALYANKKIEQWTKTISSYAQNWTKPPKNYQSYIGMPED